MLLLQLIVFLLKLTVIAEFRPVFILKRAGGGIGINNIQLKGIVVQHQCLMLRMNVDQPVAKFFQNSQNHRSVVYKGSRFSGRVNFAP